MIQDVLDDLRVKAMVAEAQKSVDEIVVNLLRQFLEGEISEVNSNIYGLRVDYRKLQKLFDELQIVTHDDLDLNGWENDYTETYEYTTPNGVKSICVYGTMADGSFRVQWDD